ncbi:MAG: ATP-grasp domain-containing protein, partial [Candidatus Aminicenantales bacterium]
LGIARSLYSENIPVCFIDEEFSISRFTRYKENYFKSPPYREEDDFLDFLVKIAKAGMEGWVVFPTTDESVRLISQTRNYLKKYFRVPTPCWEIARYFLDKRLTLELAQKSGIDIPETKVISSCEELRATELKFPLIVKPAFNRAFFSRKKKKAILIHNSRELHEFYKKAADILAPDEILIQELIPGRPDNLFSLAVFVKNGQIKAKLTARRTRQHPVDFGHASTFVETFEIPELEKIGERLLAESNFYGLAEIEFKFDSRDRKFKLLEVNPRTWGWHTIGIKAGVNFPLILYRDMTGEEVEVNSFCPGIKWMRIITDFPVSMGELLKGHIKIGEYLASFRGEKEYAVFSLKDPLPFLSEFFLIPFLWKKRGF